MLGTAHPALLPFLIRACFLVCPPDRELTGRNQAEAALGADVASMGPGREGAGTGEVWMGAGSDTIRHLVCQGLNQVPSPSPVEYH